MKFPMTLDGWVKGITAVTVVALCIWFPVMFQVIASMHVPWGIMLLVQASAVIVGVALLGSAADTASAVKVNHDALVIERRALGAYEVAWSDVAGVQEGPPIKLRGDVRRVFGNGGFFGFNGLFTVKDVGTVRAWGSKLDRPTVLVSRKSGRTLLLGVDDAPGLLDAIRKRLAHRP